MTPAPSVLLPAWFLDRRRDRAVWIFWILVFAVFSGASILRPGMREVLPVYRDASQNWLKGQEIYPPRREVYPAIDYPIPFVILFVPFAKLPPAACAVVWRALEMAIFVTGLHRLSRVVRPGPESLFLLVSILSIHAAFGSIKNGQTNLVVAGAMAHAAVDWVRSRRVATAAWLLLGVVAKPIVLVMVLLASAADFALMPPMASGLALAAAFPLAFESPPVLLHHYSEWVARLIVIAPSAESRFDDLNGILRSAGISAPTGCLFALRAAAALITLVLWLLAAKRADPVRRGLLLLSLSATYLMLFNPRTESNSYVILSPAIAAFGGLLLVVDRRRVGWLMVALDLAMANGSFGRTIWKLTRLWLMPLLAAMFLAFLIAEILRLEPPSKNSRAVIRAPSR